MKTKDEALDLFIRYSDDEAYILLLLCNDESYSGITHKFNMSKRTLSRHFHNICYQLEVDMSKSQVERRKILKDDFGPYIVDWVAFFQEDLEMEFGV